MNVGHAILEQEQAHTERRKMNGIMQEQKTLQLSRNRQGLATAPPSFAQNSTPNDRSTRQIFTDTNFADNEFAAEVEHAHWGLNE